MELEPAAYNNQDHMHTLRTYMHVLGTAPGCGATPAHEHMYTRSLNGQFSISRGKKERRSTLSGNRQITLPIHVHMQ